MGRTLILVGVAFLVLGILVSMGDRLPFRIGRLPGDFVWKGKNTTFYFPVATSLLLSLFLTVLLAVFSRR